MRLRAFLALADGVSGAAALLPSQIGKLPQLLKVLAGNMNLVGPRPNCLRECLMYSDAEKRILDVNPGITDIASIVFFDGENILAGCLGLAVSWVGFRSGRSFPLVPGQIGVLGGRFGLPQKGQQLAENRLGRDGMAGTPSSSAPESRPSC